MAHATTPDGPDKGRRRFLGAVGAGIAALIGWPLVRSATRDGTTASTVAQEATTTAPTATTPARTQGDSAAPSPSTPASTTTAAPTTTSPTEVAGATVTTQPAPDGTAGTAAPTTTTTQAATTSTSGPASGPLGLVVIEKAAWSETPDGSGYRVQDQITAVTIHHTAVVLTDNRDAPDRFRQHEAYHRSQGWPDIAYHMLIDRAGNVYEGRPLWAIGDTFTNYDPTGHFLPVLEGDFDNQSPSDAQLEALSTVTAWALNHYGLTMSVVAGHRDLAATSCPGDHLYHFITSDEFRAKVAARTAQGVTLTLLGGPAAGRLVASIEA